MPDVDFSNFWRYLLTIIGTVYATVLTVQSLWGWYVWLSGQEKYVSMLRQYVVLQGLRLRFRTFWGDVIICILLCGVLLIIWQLHVMIRIRML